MSKAKVAIIGAGVAGLAAATTLAQQQVEVHVFEASAHLGGRARGVAYKGMMLDNGQHILLGAYRETLRLLKLAGVKEADVLLRLPLALTVLNQSAVFSLKAHPHLPAPLHIVWGILTASGLSLNDKLRAIFFMGWLKLKQFKLQQDESLQALLQRKQQSAMLIQCLWEPLCLAALNTSIAIASAQVFLNVLRDSFDQQKHDADLLLPKTDLSSLIAQPLASFLHQHSGTLHTSMPVSNIQQGETGFTLICGEQTLQFSHVIIACGPHQLASLTASLPKLGKVLNHFDYQPITTVYLQYAEHLSLPQPMLGMANTSSQWLFDRGQMCGQAGLIAVVISAHAPLQLTQTALAELVASEIALQFPQFGAPLWHKVITEKRATFSCEVALNRPSYLTAYDGLLLAGDYIAGDYPATIEGAVRSGITCAEHILQHALNN
ncbi:MAG TPA: hydroxysqualene dehydroxylase HpnE [Methylophilus sp.]